MKYNQPYGESDVDAPYVNGNPSTGTMGSIPPAASIEHDQREVVEVISRANSRGYKDFSDTLCAVPATGDLQQLRKAVEGFVRALPIEFSDLIDTFVTFTVHGGGADFANLFDAQHYLSKYKITSTGRVILQLRGTVGAGTATQYVYTEKVVFDHPQNHRIFVLGATMRSACPSDHTGYTLTGTSSGARTSDTAANLAMLRTKFATELRFTNGRGIEIMGTNLGCLDGLLITSDGSTSSDGLFTTCGITVSASDTELFTNYLTDSLGGHPANGVAIVGFAGANVYIGQGGNMSAFGIGYPLVSLGSGGSGFQVNAGGRFQPTGIALSFSNANHGFDCSNGSWMFFDHANCESSRNAVAGVNGHSSVLSTISAKVWANANWGFVADTNCSINVNGTVFSISGVFNAAGDITANRMSIVTAGGITGTNSAFAPAMNTVGQNNSLITNT